MILMREHLLQEIYEKRQSGMSTTAIKTQMDISLTQPTINKLVNHYISYLSAKGQQKKRIYDSLFPEWLESAIQTQDPHAASYEGLFPNGKWLIYGTDLKNYRKQSAQNNDE